MENQIYYNYKQILIDIDSTCLKSNKDPKGIKVIAVSMERGPSMYESLKQGKPVDVEELETLADCLGGSIGLNNKFTFDIAKETIDDFVLVNEDKIAEGIKLNFTEKDFKEKNLRMKLNFGHTFAHA